VQLKAVFITTLLLAQTPLSNDIAQRTRLFTCQAGSYQLQVENAQLRAALADANARLDSARLTTQGASLQEMRATLEREIKAALGGSETDTVDWTTDPPSLKPQAQKEVNQNNPPH
jgi:hypothetical protein